MRVQQYDYVILSNKREAIVTIDDKDSDAAKEKFREIYPDDYIFDVTRAQSER